MLKQLFNPLSNKFDLVRLSGMQTRVIPVTADMTTAQFRAEGTNLQWIVEAFSVENGIYTPVVISYSKSETNYYTVINFSWNTTFTGEIHVTYGVGKFVPQVNIPEQYYNGYQGRKLVYPRNGETDFDIYAVMPESCYCMFSNCTSLTTIPLLDTSQVITMNNMFSNCTSLTTIPLLDTSQVINMRSMFYGCASLTTIPLLDTSQVTNMTHMFYGCTALESCQLLNLRTNISFSDSPLLSLESIQFMIQNSYSATNHANLKAFTMRLHPDTLAKVQADTTVYEWNGQSYTGLIALATAMQITIQ